jgi:gas vesicle protein GvpG
VGLISGLFLLPLAPVRGVVWLGEVIAEEAERVQAAEQSPDRALAELEIARATGEISDEEAAEQEAALLERLVVERNVGRS